MNHKNVMPTTEKQKILRVISLLDTRAYPTRSFAKLYALRWAVEENYKRTR